MKKYYQLSVKKYYHLLKIGFGVSRTEAKGLFWVSFLLVLLLGFQFIPNAFLGPILGGGNIKADEEKLNRITQQLENAFPVDSKTRSTPKAAVYEMTMFDPNRATKAKLLSLGMPSFLARRVVNYRNKGGRFYVKHDLCKIYGLDDQLFHKLLPYIDLPSKSLVKPKYIPPVSRVVEKRKIVEEEVPVAMKALTPELIDLNKADTTLLKRYRGIGSVLALRIVKYRNILGGFVSVKQLGEVYGLDPTVANNVNGFVEKGFEPKQIKLNSSSAKTLSYHPYITYKIAKLIVNYRYQHGKFVALNDIKALPVIDTVLYEKLVPYLSLE